MFLSRAHMSFILTDFTSLIHISPALHPPRSQLFFYFLYFSHLQYVYFTYNYA